MTKVVTFTPFIFTIISVNDAKDNKSHIKANRPNHLNLTKTQITKLNQRVVKAVTNFA